ncbi:hypothetical protein AMC87_CH03671 [Rhizobium phaseoli]|nr:hypothetical protein AMC87_CH03671 [Rhizobium phaseoli]EGE56005.1 hypothetical protein RHECNPAF_770047 [Rhizobium etli CNPAF512]
MCLKGGKRLHSLPGSRTSIGRSANAYTRWGHSASGHRSRPRDHMGAKTPGLLPRRQGLCALPRGALTRSP